MGMQNRKKTHTTLIFNIKNGGLKMIDITYYLKAVKASWVKGYINKENEGSWKPFINVR
jgi:hypothetical protein